ncbi:tyrosine-type recombinase/integrase, partial [Bacteroides finegoldii]
HILHRYKNDLNSFFKLKDNSNLNKELNVLAKLAGISKHISFHTARHTNATLLIYNGANITTVQKLLGHKSVKTTQVYANIMDITIVRDLEKAASQKNE